MNETKSIARDYWSNGRYFDANKQNVAGNVFDSTNRFGEKIKEVRGTLDDIEKILPWSHNAYNNWLLTIDNITPEQKEQENLTAETNIATAIAATKLAEQEPPSIDGLDLLSFDEIRERYASDISDDEYIIWANYQKSRLFDFETVSRLNNGWKKYLKPLTTDDYLVYHNQNLVAYDGREWVPAAIYYAGSVYDKVSALQAAKTRVVQVIGENRYAKQLSKLENSFPNKLKLSAPKSERLIIKPLDPFIENFTISGYSDGTIFENEQTLIEAFKDWLRSLPKKAFESGSNAFQIISYGINMDRFPKDTTTAKKIEIKRNVEQDLSNLFSEFLATMLTAEDQQKLELLWNREYNGWVEINFDKLPVGFEINRYFKSGPIDPRKALWDGVKFLSANGSGVIAFDVGVGKTMTAILAVAQALYTGQCKRPLIVVPNPTYEKWISETIGEFNEDGTVKVHGVLPQFKDRINDYYNLGVSHIDKALNTPPEDYSITFVTFEGLTNMGLSAALQDEIGQELLSILSQGLEGRDLEQLREKIDELMGEATAKTVVNFDDLGFDYLVFDEAHNAKKIFTKVKGDIDDEKQNRGRTDYAITSGNPSKLGTKTFMLSQYIMRKNKMRNVCLLTATPFTNSPLEVYSMLALVAYQALEKRGIKNIKAFFDKFVNQTFEEVFTTRGTLEEKPVIKNFANRQVLQNILFSYMLYKTGDEANVPRPKKVVYPRTKDETGTLLPYELQVDTALPPTKDQEYWMREIAAFANGTSNAIEGFMGPKYYDEKGNIPGRDLLAVSFGRQVTISPYLLKVRNSDNKDDIIYLADNPEPTPEQFIQSSPKLQYTISAIKTIKQWHDSRSEPMSGVVIYLNQGVGFHGMVAEYLRQQVGLKTKEVATLGGKVSSNQKENVKKKFLAGEIKVIIGSSTIKEGIDLQNRSTTLFNLTLDWNPTDIQQLEGRIWRQGNQHSHVRIVTPLIENSVDVFMFQKLEEKTSRINNIWYRSGRTNVLDIDSFDPRDLKLGLMTDPTERARTEIKNEAKKVEQKIDVLNEYIQELSQSKSVIKDVDEAGKLIDQYFADAKKYLINQLQQARLNLEQDEYSRKADKEKDERIVKSIEGMLAKGDSQPAQFAMIKRHAREKISSSYGYDYTFSRRINFVEETDKKIKQLDRLQKNVLNQHNLTYLDNLQPLIDNYEKERATLTEKLTEIRSDANFQKVVDDYKRQREEADKQSMSVDFRVQQFTTHNYLLSCLKDLHDCSLDDAAIKARPKTKVIDITPEPNNEAAIIKQRIESLQIAYETLGDEKIKTRIDALEIALSLAA